MMFPSKITINILALIIFLLQASANGQDRTITSKLNPGCTDCGTNNSLIYVKAEGQTDTIHQIWDFTRGIPTIIFAVAGINTSIDISWDGLRPSKFVMSEKPHYSFASILDKIYEYNDSADRGYMERNRPHLELSLKKLSWELRESIFIEKEVMVKMHGSLHEHGRNGTVEMKLDLLPYKDYASDLPRLIHTANSTLLDVSLVNLTTSAHYNSSRFALHLVLVSTDPGNETLRNVMRKSLDDEHTPGVFEIIEIKTPACFTSDEGGFLQFRPVGYTESGRGVASSTVAHVSNFTWTSLPQRSTAKTFYTMFDEENLLVQDMIVSFGEPGDGFYRQHNYTAWSYTIGFGAPPVESFSVFVVSVICAGLGLPVLLALSGVSYVLAQRRRRARAHTRLADDR